MLLIRVLDGWQYNFEQTIKQIRNNLSWEFSVKCRIYISDYLLLKLRSASTHSAFFIEFAWKKLLDYISVYFNLLEASLARCKFRPSSKIDHQDLTRSWRERKLLYDYSMTCLTRCNIQGQSVIWYTQPKLSVYFVIAWKNIPTITCVYFKQRHF